MLARDIQEFSKVREHTRAYMCYLFSRNIPNKMPYFNLDTAIKGLEKIQREIDRFDALYILSSSGIQVIDNLTKVKKHQVGKSENRASRAYYYRAVKEKKCILTDPYPSAINGELVVTASYPIYNEHSELQFIACIDISLKDLLQIIKPTSFSNKFENFSKFIYFMFALSLFAISGFMFLQGVTSIFFEALEIEEMFKATILLTLSLAIFDLVKAIFEEEVLGKGSEREKTFEIHRTMIKFLGSIIIALAIEALMLVFKFAIIGPEKILYAVYLIVGVTFLLIGLTFYIRFTTTTKA